MIDLLGVDHLEDLDTECCEGRNCFLTKDSEQDLSLETNRKRTIMLDMYIKSCIYGTIKNSQK